MKSVDQYYYLILDNDAVGADTIAAAEIQSGLIEYNDINITTVLEEEVSQNVEKILISPPCGKLIQELLGYDCDSWPYEEGEAIVIADEGNVYITGTIPNDRRRAGLILRNYPDYDILAEHSFVIIQGLSLDPDLLEIIPGKTKGEFVCGDGICDAGEKFLCYPDCGQKTCFEICSEEGYENAYCRDVPTNPNVAVCLDGEKNQGLQYCTGGKSCCCEAKETEQNKTVEKIPEAEQKAEEKVEQGFFARLFSEENSAGSVVVVALVLVSIIIIIGIIMAKG